MLELALNKSKEKASGISVGSIITTTTALNQPNQLHHPNHSQQQQVPSNLEDYLTQSQAMAPPPTCMSITYSNTLPTTLTADINSSMRKGKIDPLVLY